MNKRFCDRCNVEVKEYSVVSIIGKEYTTFTTATSAKMMRDMELCPNCSQEIINACQEK